MSNAQTLYDEGLQLFCKSQANKSRLWYPGALRKFTQAIEMDSSFCLTYRMRAKCHQILGENDKSDEDLRKYEELKNNAVQPQAETAPAQSYYEKGKICMEPGGLIWEALYYLTKAIEADPNFAPPYNSRADIYFTLGMADESLEDIKRHGELTRKDKK